MTYELPIMYEKATQPDFKKITKLDEFFDYILYTEQFRF